MKKSIPALIAGMMLFLGCVPSQDPFPPVPGTTIKEEKIFLGGVEGIRKIIKTSRGTYMVEERLNALPGYAFESNPGRLIYLLFGRSPSRLLCRTDRIAFYRVTLPKGKIAVMLRLSTDARRLHLRYAMDGLAFEKAAKEICRRNIDPTTIDNAFYTPSALPIIDWSLPRVAIDRIVVRRTAVPRGMR